MTPRKFAAGVLGALAGALAVALMVLAMDLLADWVRAPLNETMTPEEMVNEREGYGILIIFFGFPAVIGGACLFASWFGGDDDSKRRW